MAKKRKAMDLTEASRLEFGAKLRRLLGRWRRNNLLKAKADQRDKDTRAEIRTHLEILGQTDDELKGRDERTPGVKAQLVVKEAVKTSDEGNIELCREELPRAKFDACCPRKINVKELAKHDEELLDSLAVTRSTSLRLDLVQAEAASKSA